MLIKKPTKVITLLSYIFPVNLYKKKKSTGRQIVIQLYKGQIQMAFGRVFYSDGHDYFPIKMALQKIGFENINKDDSFLCLGSGLGSLSQILQKKYPDNRFSVHYVELDDDILELCKEVTQLLAPQITHVYHHEDANLWMRKLEKEYNYIVVDIFDEHIVPMFVFKRPFIEQLHSGLQSGGHLIMNLMFQSEFQQHEFEVKFAKIFPVYHIISTRKNKIYIAQK